MYDKKYQNIIKLSNAERYDYLVRKVADFEKIYLIYGKFWKMSMSVINGIKYALIFPEKEFGKIHISQESSKRVKEMDLYTFINWLNKDQSNKIHLAVFPNQGNDAKVVNASELKNDLLKECKQYE